MKANKLFRKLALSGVALGAAAVTLTATTFAWYTSNTEADVTAVSGQTEAKGADSLFIATAYDYNADTTVKTWNDYLATAEPSMTGGADITLKPVYSNVTTAVISTGDSTANPATSDVAGRSYNAINKVTKKVTGEGQSQQTTWEVSYKDEDNTNFMEFVFRVRSSSVLEADMPLYFSKFNITTAAQTGKTITQIPLATGADEVGVINSQAYGADLMKALKLDVSYANVALVTAEDATNNTIPAAGATTRLGATDAAEVKTYGFEALGAADTNIAEGKANAVGYYNKVMGTGIAVPGSDYSAGTELTKTSSADKELSFAKLTKTATGKPFSVVEIRFVLYLDGWDNYCYDVMQGQKVDFSFEITSSAEKAVLFTK